MNLFRSEEHVTRPLAGRRPGATVPVATLAKLAHVWEGDRLDPGWRPHTREQDKASLTSVGLADDLWRLP
jgi:hypothetical protein